MYFDDIFCFFFKCVVFLIGIHTDVCCLFCVVDWQNPIGISEQDHGWFCCSGCCQTGIDGAML